MYPPPRKIALPAIHSPRYLGIGYKKREALRNAVANSVLKSAPPPDLQQLYLSILDNLSPWHLRLLYLFRDPVAWFKRAGKPFPSATLASLKVVVNQAFPETREFEVQDVWRDLFARGLVNTQDLGIGMTGEGLKSGRTTSLGTHIVDFTINDLDDA